MLSLENPKLLINQSLTLFTNRQKNLSFSFFLEEINFYRQNLSIARLSI